MSHDETAIDFLRRDSHEKLGRRFWIDCDFLRCVLREVLVAVVGRCQVLLVTHERQLGVGGVLLSTEPALFTALLTGPWCLTTPLDAVTVEKPRFLAHDSPNREIGFVTEEIGDIFLNEGNVHRCSSLSNQGSLDEQSLEELFEGRPSRDWWPSASVINAIESWDPTK